MIHHCCIRRLHGLEEGGLGAVVRAEMCLAVGRKGLAYISNGHEQHEEAAHSWIAGLVGLAWERSKAAPPPAGKAVCVGP